MFFACGIWCVADFSSVSTSSEQTALVRFVDNFSKRKFFAFLQNDDVTTSYDVIRVEAI